MKKLNFILGFLLCAGIGFSMAQGTATGGTTTTTKAKPAVPQPGKASATIKPVPAKTAPKRVTIKTIQPGQNSQQAAGKK